MKLFTSVVAVSVAAVSAEKEAYGAPAKPAYEPYTAPAKPVYYASYDPYTGGAEPASNYGYSPYPVHSDPYAKYHYADFVEPVYPQKSKPNPFIHYPKDVHNDLRIPHLGNYHCFLTGAPWTKCGRRSLTSYFLDQCMVFYYAMSTNVDGICGEKKKETAAVEKDYYGHHGKTYGHQLAHYGPPVVHYAPEPAYKTEAPTPAPTSAAGGYGGARLENYQKERCLQNAYVSITTALVLCLTENMIRIKYIEHYAKDAARNPIEGPILYLKKLHTFVRSVLSCAGSEAADNYPNLWNDFRNKDGALTYSPNMPYVVNEDKTVVLDQHMSAESTGFNDITVNQYFLCNNVPDLDGGDVYKTDAANHHYSLSILGRCSNSNAFTTLGYSNVIKRCPYITEENEVEGSPKGADEQYYADTTLKGLYEAVNPVTRQSTAAFRVRTIAEMAVGNVGSIGQPLLEGFGIMYFCAFYACKANNGGNLDGSCFPSFDCESDWTVPSQVGSYDDFNEYGDKVEYCLSKKYLTKEDVAGNDKVRAFKKLLRRSYVCMTENRVVDFYKYVASYSDKGEAWAQVYMRHLAVEKCYEESKGFCASNVDLYQALLDALKDLEEVCSTRRNDYYAKKHYVPKYPAHYRPYAAQPHYG